MERPRRRAAVFLARWVFMPWASKPRERRGAVRGWRPCWSGRSGGRAGRHGVSRRRRDDAGEFGPRHFFRRRAPVRHDRGSCVDFRCSRLPAPLVVSCASSAGFRPAASAERGGQHADRLFEAAIEVAFDNVGRVVARRSRWLVGGIRPRGGGQRARRSCPSGRRLANRFAGVVSCVFAVARAGARP